MENKEVIRLSPTTGFGLFKECPRCFWLHYNENVHRPRGIFPSLPSGMDLVIKKYFDRYRGSLPPELGGKVKGKLTEDIRQLNKWRNWRTGLKYKDEKLNAILFGALDDCVEYEKKYIPLDYKTRGFAPKEGDSERYYQTQLDTYALLLESNGYPAGNFSYLVYYYPEKVEEGGIVKFNIVPKEIPVSAERARKLFGEAVKCLRGPIPASHSNCEYCSWGSSLMDFD